MSTPRKNSNYYAPYSQHVGQYPSQTSDYRTQHTGGLQQTPYEDRQQNTQRSTPHFYQSRAPQQQQQQQQSGFYEDRQSAPHFFRNKSQGRNYGQRGGGSRRGFHQQQQHQQFNNGKNTNTFSQYFHSSMLEDPWQELMQRHQAIHGSIIESKDIQDT